MKSEYKRMRLDELTPSPINPRKIKHSELMVLCESIKGDVDFMECRPILVNCINGQNIIYSGHQRYEAYKYLKYEEIPCIVEYDLSEDVMKERMIKDNVHCGSWDDKRFNDNFSKGLADFAGVKFDVGTFDSLSSGIKLEKPKYEPVVRFDEDYTYVLITASNKEESDYLKKTFKIDKQEDEEINKVGVGRVVNVKKLKQILSCK